MRKVPFAIVVLSCSALMVCGTSAEAAKTVTVKAHGINPTTPSPVVASTEADMDPYGKANGEWHAYLARYGYQVDSKGKLVRKKPEELRQFLLWPTPSQREPRQLMNPNRLSVLAE